MWEITKAFSQTICSIPPAGCGQYPSTFHNSQGREFSGLKNSLYKCEETTLWLGFSWWLQTKTYTYFLGTWSHILQSVIHDKMRSKKMNQWIYLLASDTDNPQRAPAALSWRPGEAFAQDCARATWIHHIRWNLKNINGEISYHVEYMICHQTKSGKNHKTKKQK
jgi:hypothetical protein